MKTFRLRITGLVAYETIIEAKNEESARKKFDAMLDESHLGFSRDEELDYDDIRCQEE